jgi:hypothetical protein
MNMVELKQPPKDLSNYVQAPERFNFEEFVLNLRGLIKEGTANIEIEECSLAIIRDLEKVILENGYIVQFIPIPGMTAHAHFFLKKL